MTISASFVGRVEKGKFLPESPKAFKEAFYPFEKKRVLLSLRKYQEKRSNPQNRYYFGVVVKIIGLFIGEADPEAVHDMLKNQFNYEIKVVGGKEIRVPQSTADLDTDAFAQYIERIRAWASEWLGLYIPDPNECEY